MKRLISLALALCLGLAALPVAAVAAEEEALAVVRAVGIMVGDEQGNMNLSAPVTRAQFAKMLAYAAGQDEGAAGYSPFRDVTHTHWAAGYIKTASDSGWFLGYVDGTFRPENTILYEEGATAVLRMLGYTEADYAGVYPTAQISKFKSLGLGDGVAAGQGDTLTRSDCAQIFYNVLNATTKGGQVQAQVLGYALNTSGKIDYQSLLLSEAKGPYVADTARWTASLPFSAASATVYLNGKQVSSFTPEVYDVYYYNAGGNVLWVYTQKAIGIYQGASPGQTSPESVTVAGVTYKVGEAAAAQKLSSMGAFAYGDAVCLLLGMDDAVADVVAAESVDGLRYGVVIEAGMETYTVGTGTRTDYVLTVAATDGNTYSYVCADTNLTVGSLVSAGYENGAPVVTRLGSKGITGKVSASAAKLGNAAIASDVEIIEVTGDGSWQPLYASRLAGSTLKSGDVKYYTLDSAGAIDRMIVGDITGDMHSYGILTAADETSVDTSDGEGVVTTVRSGKYQYILEGKAGSLTLSSDHFDVGGTGPALFKTAGTADTGAATRTFGDIELLGKVAVASVGATAIRGSDGASYTLSSDVQVYIEQDGAYHLSQLSSVTGGDYTLTAYVDSGFSAGQQVRVIIARP